MTSNVQNELPIFLPFLHPASLPPSEGLELVKHEVDPAARRGMGTTFTVKIAPDI
jgi:hypothetical protein